MRLWIVTLLLLVGGGCASSGEYTRRDSNVLTLEEIQATHHMDAHEIVRGLRPHWLRIRGPNSFYSENPIMVYVDGHRMGGPEALSSIPKLNIREIRFYDAAAAQSRFGLNNTNGAIAVRTRSG